VINSVNDLLHSTVDGVEHQLGALAPDALGFFSKPGTIRDTDDEGNVLLSQEEEDEIKKGVHKLETLLEAAVDRSFDGFELFVLRNILVVEPELCGWLRLEHHQGVDFNAVSQREPPEPIDGPLLPAAEEQARLRQLRETLLGTLNFNLDLRAEREAYDRDLEQLRSVITSLNGPPSADDEILPFSIIRGAKDTKSDATFVASQLALVRNLIEEAKPRHKALLTEKHRAAASDGGEGTLGPDAQRKQYIETMTRKHMEITRNVKLNARGALAGDFEAEGVGKDSDQVQRLDEIAGRWAKGNGR